MVSSKLAKARDQIFLAREFNATLTLNHFLQNQDARLGDRFLRKNKIVGRGAWIRCEHGTHHASPVSANAFMLARVTSVFDPIFLRIKVLSRSLAKQVVRLIPSRQHAVATSTKIGSSGSKFAHSVVHWRHCQRTKSHMNGHLELVVAQLSRNCCGTLNYARLPWSRSASIIAMAAG